MNPFLILQPDLVSHDLEQRRSAFSRSQRSRAGRTAIRTAIAVLGALIISIVSVDRASAAKGETLLVNEPLSAAADDYVRRALGLGGRPASWRSPSLATNLCEDDGDGVRDVFVRDLREETIVLVSRSNGLERRRRAGRLVRAFHLGERSLRGVRLVRERIRR